MKVNIRMVFWFMVCFAAGWMSGEAFLSPDPDHCIDLSNMRYDLDSTYMLMNDIDCIEY